MSRTILILGAACLIGSVVLLSPGRPKVREPLTPQQSLDGPQAIKQDRSTLELVPLTTAQVLDHADRVVYAKVSGSEVKRDEYGNIFTFTTFDVMQSLKGNSAGQITVRLLGGRLDNEEIIGPLDITFKPADRYVMFLGKNNSEQYPLIIPQGIFQVKTSGGMDVVDPLPTGLPLYHAKTDKAFSGTPGFVTLEDFLYSLKRGRIS